MATLDELRIMANQAILHARKTLSDRSEDTETPTIEGAVPASSRRREKGRDLAELVFKYFRERGVTPLELGKVGAAHLVVIVSGGFRNDPNALVVDAYAKRVFLRCEYPDVVRSRVYH